jgi:glycolate oxidase FAD binding subunit
MPVEARPTHASVAGLLRAAAADGRSVRVRAGGTKSGWGHPVAEPALELSTAGLDDIVEHNAGDLTAVVQAGVRLADAQADFGRAGQMVALDPPLGADDGATIGGIVATADSGPLRHGYGGVRDQVLGMTVALADGSVTRSGGKVIKNVAGYDLPKLFAGSFGTLGVILEVTLRLHPVPVRRATVVADSDDPQCMELASLALSASPVRPVSLDFAWERGAGMVLARYAGAAAADQAGTGLRAVEEAGLSGRIDEDDDALWARQRAAQRAADGIVLKVSALPAELSRVIRVAHAMGASAVGRAGLGLSWLVLPSREAAAGVAAVEEVRAALAPRPVVVLDGPGSVREKLDVWGSPDAGALALMRRVKQRFDPLAICNRGIFVGGI